MNLNIYASSQYSSSFHSFPFQWKIINTSRKPLWITKDRKKGSFLSLISGSKWKDVSKNSSGKRGWRREWHERFNGESSMFIMKQKVSLSMLVSGTLIHLSPPFFSISSFGEWIKLLSLYRESWVRRVLLNQWERSIWEREKSGKEGKIKSDKVKDRNNNQGSESSGSRTLFTLSLHLQHTFIHIFEEDERKEGGENESHDFSSFPNSHETCNGTNLHLLLSFTFLDSLSLFQPSFLFLSPSLIHVSLKRNRIRKGWRSETEKWWWEWREGIIKEGREKEKWGRTLNTLLNNWLLSPRLSVSLSLLPIHPFSYYQSISFFLFLSLYLSHWIIPMTCFMALKRDTLWERLSQSCSQSFFALRFPWFLLLSHSRFFMQSSFCLEPNHSPWFFLLFTFFYEYVHYIQ